jgi:hypothetical protein
MKAQRLDATGDLGETRWAGARPLAGLASSKAYPRALLTRHGLGRPRHPGGAARTASTQGSAAISGGSDPGGATPGGATPGTPSSPGADAEDSDPRRRHDPGR